MNEKYNVYLVSDSTGETLDRIFLSLKSQFANFEYYKKEFAFIRTEQQIDKIIKECNQIENSIILYTIVETKLAKYLASKKVVAVGLDTPFVDALADPKNPVPIPEGTPENMLFPVHHYFLTQAGVHTLENFNLKKKIFSIRLNHRC